jgi:nucleotide-binding universal stress UspA family protein
MKKILLAFDGTHFSEGAFEFARRLNEQQPVLLTGAFVPQTELSNSLSYSDGMGAPFIQVVESGMSEIIRQNIDRFEKLCIKNNISYKVHEDISDLVIPELKRESLYSDLLILGSELFYKDIGIWSSEEYLRLALHDVKCPVLVVPEKFDFPESIILAYDGSEDAVYSIKQFAYLFPELTGLKTLLVYASEDAEGNIPDIAQIKELATRHYNDLRFFKLKLDPKKYFNTWIRDKKSALLVSGSYGRSGLSQLFKRSFVREVILDHSLPVFIAHR